MRVSIVDIGNSKGIRIPQAILRQVSFSGEVEMEVSDGKITLTRLQGPAQVPEVDSLLIMDDRTIQLALRKMGVFDLVVSLLDADEGVKQVVYRNLSDRVCAHVRAKVEKLEKGDARDLLIERSRCAFSEAIMEAAVE